MSRNSGLRPKRSSSLSHIPVPASLRESRPSIRGRGRVDNNLATTTAARKPSLDRRLQRSSSYSNLLRTTPLQTKLSVGRTSSTRKAPSSGSRSPFMKKDRHVNDKKWVAEQFAKVKRYLEDHPDCDPNVLNNLKPPTLNTFVYVCNILFKSLDPRIDINIANYKETVIAQLKTLHYPGTASNSLLKTVNTMHAWPQVVGIFSWIIDLLALIAANASDHISRDAGSELTEVTLRYFAERYLLFNQNDNQTSADEIFVEQIAAIHGINDEEQNEFVKDIENLKNVLQEKVSQLTQITDEINVLRAENEEMKMEIEKFYIEDPAHEKQQEYNLQTLAKKKQDTKDMIMDVKGNIKKLRATISNQHCTYAEKKSIWTNIDEMKYTLELKREKMEEYMKIKSDFDYKFVDLKRKVEAEVHRLNTAIIQISVTNPEIKSLHLRDKGFHHKDFKSEVEEFIETKMSLDNKLTENIAKAKTHIELTEDESKILSSKMEKLQDTIQELVLKKEELEKKMKAADEDLKLLVINAEDIRNQYLLSINELKYKEPNLDDHKLQISKLTEEKLLLNEEFKLLQIESLQFFETLHRTSIGSLKELDKMRVSIFEKIESEETVAVKSYMEMSRRIEFVNELISKETQNIDLSNNERLKGNNLN